MRLRYILAFLFIVGILLGKSCSKESIDYLNQLRFERSVLNEGSWITNLKLARPDQGMIQRALVAKVGLGANTSEEAIYYTAYTDSEGERIISANNYVIHFKEEPPVKAFWSLTVYNRRHQLTSEFKTVVTPAVDFLYSSAALDAAYGPHVFKAPAMGRYWTLQFMEEDTDVYGYIGSRIHGEDRAVEVLVVPPDYEGESYGLEVLEMEDKKCWVIGRIHIYNKEDQVNVHALQNSMEFIPLDRYLESRR